MYTASPNRDPDGLGVLPAMWLNSKMTLVVKEMRFAREGLNRAAFARTEEEQREVLRRIESQFRQFVIFEGTIISDFQELADARWYLPEGIYLLDDRNRKFLPVSVGSKESIFTSHQLDGAEGASDYWFSTPSTTRFPLIHFSAEAIKPETRAVTLYFAAFQKRLSFTWVFDETYIPAGQQTTREDLKGLRGMWRIR